MHDVSLGGALDQFTLGSVRRDDVADRVGHPTL